MTTHFFHRHINPYIAVLIVTVVGAGATLLITRTAELIDTVAVDVSNYEVSP